MEKSLEERIIIAALKTWDAIGGDCLRCLEECGEKPVMSKKDVIETVLDASYMNIYGEDKDAYQALMKMSPVEQMSILNKAFLAPRYGW